MRAPTILFLATLAGCAVAPPSSPSGGGSGYGLDGKADGAGWCNEGEVGFMSCIVENCPDEDEECISTQCADAEVEVSQQCGECIESHFGDLELSAARCLGARVPAGPCAEDADLVECAVANCEGSSGDALLDCIDTACADESEDVSSACGECILVRGQAGTDELVSCAQDAPPVACEAADLDAILTCEAENCADLEGDAYDECLGTTCGPVFFSVAPVCFECMGNNLDAGQSMEETAATCGGSGDAPADDGMRVCSYEEINDVLSCGEASCADMTGDELNECLEANCAETLEAAELSDPCATCFIYSSEAGETLAATRAACVSAPETDA